MSILNRHAASRTAGRRARAIVIGMLLMLGVGLSASIGHATSAIRLVKAETSDNGDGRIDRIVVTTNAPVVLNQPKISDGTSPGFFVVGHSITTIAAGDTPNTIFLNIAPGSTPDTDATATVGYIGGGGGATDPSQTAEVDDVTMPATDGAGPVLLSVLANDKGNSKLFNSTGEEMFIKFSEPVTLAGALPLDRWSHLEAAIKFNNEAPGNFCATDGQGGNIDFNFPQPNSASAPDPVIAPASATDFVSSIHVRYGVGDQASTRTIPGVNAGCRVGIDPTAGFSSYILDEASNPAHAQQLDDAAGLQTAYIYPVDAVVDAVNTRTVDSDADGKLDSLTLVFDQRIDDTTIKAQLSHIDVSLGGKTAIVDETNDDTGATPNDNVFVVHFTQPTGANWGTVDRPTVAYTKPSNCTTTSGTGLKAIVPTGGSFRACVNSFDIQAADGAGPILKSVKTLDINGNGKIDHVRATFGEPIANAKPNGWKIDGTTAKTALVDANDARIVNIEVATEATLPDTDATPSLTYMPVASALVASQGTTDAAMNQVPASTKTATDGAAPRVTGVTVYDSNTNGSVDRAVVEYSEPIVDPAGSAASRFDLGGTAASGFASANPDDNDPDVAGDNILSFAFTGLTGTDTKDVAVASGGTAIEDAVGNDETAQTILKASVIDKAAPVGTVEIAPGAPMSAGVSTITVTFSEAMKNVAPTATLGTKTVNPVTATGHTNGWDDANPAIWTGSVTIVGTPNGGDCPQPTGCPVTASLTGAQDLATNPQAAPATKDTEIDTIAPQPPTLTGFTAAEASGETVPANTLNMFTDQFSVNATIVPADAQGGIATVVVDGTPLAGATDSSISATAASVSPGTNFADRAALQTLLAEQPSADHTIGVQLCDDANNCTTSATPITVHADYTPVSMALGAPNGGNVVAGGSTVAITWDGDDAGAGFDHVELDYSTNDGSTYTHSISNAEATRDGSYDWTVPVIDVANARVRAVAVDVNGNKGIAASANSFSIDSTAPKVSITAPASSYPFVPAGQDYTVKWSVTDASIDRVTNPITIEYSTTSGSTWHAINGGSYSKADDGAEVWHVPSGGSFSTMLRIKAVDATSKATTKLSSKLARGVDGFTVDRVGNVYAFGTASTTTNEYDTWSSDVVRGIAVRSNGASGYVLTQSGRLYPFSAGSASKPSRPTTTTFSKDLARGVALRTDSSGYTLDAYGKLHAFGGAPTPHVSKTWSGDYARGVVILSSGTGGYVLDKYGRLYPFSVGSNARPRSIQSSTISSTGAVRSVVLRSNQTSGWLLTSDGKLHAFGGAPSRSTTGTGSSANAKGIVRVTNDGGYWMDGKGVLHAWGTAFGNPTKKVMSSGSARGTTN